MGRATRSRSDTHKTIKISIHALRGEGDLHFVRELSSREVISIHALRGEGDQAVQTAHNYACAISIHALRGEGDQLP